MREHPDRDALVVRHQGVALDLRGAGRGGRPRRPLARRPRPGQGRPRRDLGAELRRVGRDPVRDREARRDPREHQPGLPHQRARLRAAAVRLPGARLGAVVQDLGLPGDDRRGPRRPARARARAVHRRGVVRRRARRGRVARARPRSSRSTSSTRAAPRAGPRAPRSATPTSSTTGSSSASSATTRRRTGSASRCPSTTASAWSWATSAASPTAPAWSSRRRRSSPRRRSRRSPRSAARASTACRRCSSPSSRTRASTSHDLSSLRTGIMAGSPCPEQVMRKVIDRMHMEGVTICYGMTETSPVSTQTTAEDELERRVGTVGRVHPHVEVKVVDPETGRTRPARRAGRALHPRLQRDARLLGGAGAHQRGDRRRRASCTPATSRRWTTRAT